MRFVLSLPILLLTLTASAQRDARRDHRWGDRPSTLGGGFEVGIPIGEFDDAWGRQMAGLSANFTMPMRRLPFSYGFDFGWQRMGARNQEVPVSIEGVSATKGDLRVRSNVYGYHALLRLQPLNGRISPYAELMTGARHFITRTEIKVDGMDENAYEERNASAFIGSIGWAAGLHYAPSRNFYTEIRLERLNGGQVEYVDPRSVEIAPDGSVSYGTLDSGTRVVNVTFGVGLRF